jgi:hypothetical protein
MLTKRTTQRDHDILAHIKKYFDTEARDEETIESSDLGTPREDEYGLDDFVVSDDHSETSDENDERETVGGEHNTDDEEGSVKGDSLVQQPECCPHHVESSQYLGGEEDQPIRKSSRCRRIPPSDDEEDENNNNNNDENKNDDESPAAFVIDSNFRLVMTDGELVKLGDIKKKTIVYCPKHEMDADFNARLPSAFVDIDRSGKPFVKCSSCGESFKSMSWMDFSNVFKKVVEASITKETAMMVAALDTDDDECVPVNPANDVFTPECYVSREEDAETSPELPTVEQLIQDVIDAPPKPPKKRKRTIDPSDKDEAEDSKESGACTESPRKHRRVLKRKADPIIPRSSTVPLTP